MTTFMRGKLFKFNYNCSKNLSPFSNKILLFCRPGKKDLENGLFFSRCKNVLLGDRRTPALKCRFNISRMPFCLIDLEMAQMYC